MKATSPWETPTFWEWAESRQDCGRYLPNSWISQDSGYGGNAVLGIFSNNPGRYRIEVTSGGEGQAPGPTISRRGSTTSASS